jgi:hypothetical protein
MRLLAKVRKLEGLRDVVFFDDVPTVHLCFEGGELLTLERGTPPRQATHVLAARSDIVEVILPPTRETLTPLRYCRSSELFGMRKDERLVQPNSLGCAWKKSVEFDL